MILCIGEILIDLFQDEGEKFEAHVGGAPFNVAVNILEEGGKVGFVGRVGKDSFGKYITNKISKLDFNYLDIQEDPIRNTTLAIVTLNNGERNFAFFRNDTADYNIQIDTSIFNQYNIIHIGSLLLKDDGINTVKEIIKYSKENNVILSFDVNYRDDLFSSLDEAKEIYKDILSNARIVKYSEEEYDLFKGNIIKDQLVIITMGEKGCKYIYNNLNGAIPSTPIKPIDTTGAGDAFFGSFLANIDGKTWTKENIENSLKKASIKGKNATQYKGAIKL